MAGNGNHGQRWMFALSSRLTTCPASTHWVSYSSTSLDEGSDWVSSSRGRMELLNDDG